MNAKKAKKLRKAAALFPDHAAVVTLHQRTLLNGIPHLHNVVNPILYPVGSRRRVYQGLKAGRASEKVEIAEAPAEKLAA